MNSSFDLGLPSRCLVSSSEMLTNNESFKDNQEFAKKLTEREVSIDKLFEDLGGRDMCAGITPIEL